MKRIGLFVCWCGSNIGGVIDVPAVVQEASKFPESFMPRIASICVRNRAETILRLSRNTIWTGGCGVLYTQASDRPSAKH